MTNGCKQQPHKWCESWSHLLTAHPKQGRPAPAATHAFFSPAASSANPLIYSPMQWRDFFQIWTVFNAAFPSCYCVLWMLLRPTTSASFKRSIEELRARPRCCLAKKNLLGKANISFQLNEHHLRYTMDRFRHPNCWCRTSSKYIAYNAGSKINLILFSTGTNPFVRQ